MKAKKAIASNLSDFGTPELQRRGIEIGHNMDGQKVARRKAQIPLDTYYNRGCITIDQYNAGKEYFRLWFYGSEKGNIPSMNFDKKNSRAIVDYEKCVIMEEFYNRATKSIDGIVRQLCCYRVCCIGEWAGYLKNAFDKNKRMDILRCGLDDLDRHFRGLKRKKN